MVVPDSALPDAAWVEAGLELRLSEVTIIGPIVSLSLFLGGAQLTPQPPPPTITRDTPGASEAQTGKAVIRGRVTERDTGRPVARAIVMLESPAIRRSPQEGPLQSRTDSEGRYEFTGLAAGEYGLTVRPDEYRAVYLPQMFGEDQPADFRRMRRPRGFTLAEGQVRDDTNVALWRAFAIEGRVVDEFGEPLTGVPVRPRLAETGRNVPTSGPFEFHSDDRGLFRIFGLHPGRYYVCANFQSYSSPFNAADTDRYVETCHPAATADDMAQPITLANGDIGGVEIRVQRTRAFTVSGTAVDSSGDPLQSGHVNLMQFDRDGGSGGGSIEVREGGRFIARGLTPGEYAIQANTRPPWGPNDTEDGELAHVPFRINSANVENLVVVTRKTSRVRGRVIFEDATQGPPAGPMIVRTITDFESGMTMMRRPPEATVETDLTFELSGLFEPTLVTLSGAPAGWVVNTVRYKGRDVTDAYVDFTGARDGDLLDITLTNRVARVSGRVVDDSSKPTQDAVVMLLRAEPSGHSARLFRSLPAGNDGAFKIGPIRPGEYLIVAVVGADMIIQPRARKKYIERIAAVAHRIAVAENEDQVVELRVAKVP